jgi:hypothetical protein
MLASEQLQRKDLKEKDPNGKDAKQSGSKLDSGKSPVFRGLIDYFPRACMAVAEVSQRGAEKYVWKGWEDVPDGINRYSDAIIRHICKEAIEGKIDPDFGLLHKAHVAWNALAVLELELRHSEEAKHWRAELEEPVTKLWEGINVPVIPQPATMTRGMRFRDLFKL